MNRLEHFEASTFFRLATFLDPRYAYIQQLKCVKCKKISLRSLFRMKCKYFNDVLKQSVIESIDYILTADLSGASQSSNSTDEPPAKKSKDFSLYDFEEFSEPTDLTVKAEINLYLTELHSGENVCPLAYWKFKSSKYPNLCKLARRYLSFPASSGPVERIFSSTGKIFRADRAKLSDHVFSQLSFMKCNKNYNKKD